MAYDTKSLVTVIPRMGEGEGGANAGETAAVHIYRSADPRATVIGAGYIDDGVDKGIRVNDILIIVDNAAVATIHLVSVVTAAGLVTATARPAIP